MRGANENENAAPGLAVRVGGGGWERDMCDVYCFVPSEAVYFLRQKTLVFKFSRYKTLFWLVEIPKKRGQQCFIRLHYITVFQFITLSEQHQVHNRNYFGFVKCRSAACQTV